MMRLYIDSQLCPFDGERRLNLCWSAAALRSIDSARTGQTVTLDIPSTPQTDALFGHARDLQSAAEAFNECLHTARIECDGATVFEGRAVLSAVTQDPNGAVRYGISITGGAARWARQAAMTMFDALPMEFSMRLTPSEIMRTWTQQDAAVRFLPVLRDSYEPDYSSVGLLPAEKIMLTDDYHPFISVREILRTIFEQAGYTMRSGGFTDSALFRSLYISGAYASSDTAAIRRRMDFTAGRTTDAEAAADHAGRVYMSPYMTINSVGNYVDTFRSDDGALFACGGCMTIENDRTLFRPSASVKVGFEYSMRYVTDYRIASRQRLTGFDTLYTPTTGLVHYELANRFTDRRDSLSHNFSYRAVVFGHTDGARYRVVCTASGGGTYVMGQFSSRSGMVATGSAAAYSSPVLQTADASGAWSTYTGDWALYDGYIGETGQTEVAVTLRTPSQACSPASPASFDLMYVSGAEAGMKFRLLASSTLRPVFSSNAAYGAHLTFADIARLPVRQSVVVEAVREMFNLVILTDEQTRSVTVEPADRFYDTAAAAIDLGGRIDSSADICSSDLSLTAHDTLTLCYRDADGAVRRFNTAQDTMLGLWQSDTGRYGSVEGDDTRLNPLFSPTLNIDGRCVNAPSALLMQVCDRDAADADAATVVSPRIVCWLGMQPLPDGERWGYPSSGGEYPLAAFHLPPCAAAPQGVTLCYEDRDGMSGLHRHYDAEAQRLRRSRCVTLQMRLLPDEWSSLHRTPVEESSWLTSRAVCRLTINGETGHWLLDGISGYDPRDGMACCRFIQADTAVHPN